MGQQILIIGASSAIAQALIAQLLDPDAAHTNDGNERQIYAISRKIPANPHKAVTYLECDYSPQAIAELINDLNLEQLTRVFICNGVLHHSALQPEKKIEDINIEQFTEVLSVNTLIPMLWLQALIKQVKFSAPCCITVFSARVGSIADNKLGGWYSYRSSKAALNMLLKTAAVELQRRAKQVKLVAFHPGTTDTPLSKPFQANVPDDKLFTPKFVANQLLTIINNINYDQQLSYLDWQGETIAW